MTETRRKTIYPWLIHFNVWQKPLQCCKVISLQLIKINDKKKKKKNNLNLVPGHCLLCEGLPGRRVHIIHHMASAFPIPHEALRLASLGKPGSDHVTSLLRIFPPEPLTAATLQNQHRKRFKSGQECATLIETVLPQWISETQLRAKILSASESFLLNIVLDPVLWSPNAFACLFVPTSPCVPDTTLNASVTWVKSLN